MAVSEMQGFDTCQHLVLKFLQSMSIIDAGSLWAWGALLLAVAATFPNILNIHKLLPRLGRDVGRGEQLDHSLDAAGNGSPEENESMNDAAERTATPYLTGTSDPEQRTKGHLRFKGEERENDNLQAGIARESNWDLSSEEIVKTWAHGGSHTTVKPLLMTDNCNQRPVIVVTKNGGIGIRDPRASFPNPALVLHHQKPVSGMWYKWVEEILSGDDATLWDLRMNVHPNYNRTAAATRDFGSLWRDDDDAVIMQRKSEHDTEEDEFKFVDYVYSPTLSDLSECVAGVSSSSMVLKCLHAVRSISSGLRN